MRIGVDIDDTITSSWSTYAKEYAKVLGIEEDKLINGKPYYSDIIKEKYTLEEYFEKIKPINDKITPILPLKEDVKEIIDKIYELGHTITFITARGKETTNAYEVTKKYLDDSNIKYEKLILSPLNKSKVCLEEKIELFIDDSIKHCNAVSGEGIDVLMFETRYNKDYLELKHIKSWKEIYEYIKSR